MRVCKHRRDFVAGYSVVALWPHICVCVFFFVFLCIILQRMDRADAIRLVIFEYLLPSQREQRARVIQRCLAAEEINLNWDASRHVAGVFEEIHLLSDRLLETHGFATSYIYPYTMRHEAEPLNQRKNVSALIDSDGLFVWNQKSNRRADPRSGIRVFQASGRMCSGRLP